MKVRPVVPRDIAYRDVSDAIDYYLEEAGPDIALRFNDSVQDAYRAIAINPEIGSRRDEGNPQWRGLRSRAVKRFPYLIFYIGRADRIEVVRVLHAQRDIPASLQETAR